MRCAAVCWIWGVDSPKTKIVITKVAPMGDPIELRLRGYTLTIRIEDAKNIEVKEGEPA